MLRLVMIIVVGRIVEFPSQRQARLGLPNNHSVNQSGTSIVARGPAATQQATVNARDKNV